MPAGDVTCLIGTTLGLACDNEHRSTLSPNTAVLCAELPTWTEPAALLSAAPTKVGCARRR
jgi:hypothetical protein